MLLQKLISVFDKTIKINTDNNRRLGTMLKRKDNDDDKLIHNLIINSDIAEHPVSYNIGIKANEMVSEAKYLKGIVQTMKNKILSEKKFKP